MLRGVIFDLDGVITDTAKYHYKAWKKFADQLGISIDWSFNENLKGVSRMESLERILRHGGKENTLTQQEKESIAYEKNQYYKELIEDLTKKDLLEGIEPLLLELKANNIKIALASASKNARQIIRSLEIEDYFDYVVNAEHIKDSKPAPDTFMDALQGIGLTPDEAVGIEDAEAGIQSIRACHMKSIGIGVEGDITITGTDQLTLALIQSLLR